MKMNNITFRDVYLKHIYKDHINLIEIYVDFTYKILTVETSAESYFHRLAFTQWSVPILLGELYMQRNKIEDK